MKFGNSNKLVSLFTVCNVAYLNKAMALAESTYKFNNIKVDIFLFDRKRDLNVNYDICNIWWVEDLDIPNFNNLAFKYSVIELTTSLKPYISLYLLSKNFEKVIFLDPDIMVFNSIQSILIELENNPVIITPHYIYPKINGMSDDNRLMKFGCYNLGFFAVSASKEALEFLSWWSDRCLQNAFDDVQYGIFTDQKWVNIAQCFFPFIYVSYNPGYNVAYWNLDERHITVNTNSEYFINESFQLVFFHFSSFDSSSDSSSPANLSKLPFYMGKNDDSIITDILLLYKNTLNKYISVSSDTCYSFDYMSNGNYISPTLRRAYAAMFKYFNSVNNPFEANSEVSKFALRNNLFERNNTIFKNEGYNSISKNKRKFSIIFLVMRFLLKVLGPNKFMNFSKLMIYLSGYHRNSEMWKL
jgi:hypothetical protein